MKQWHRAGGFKYFICMVLAWVIHPDPLLIISVVSLRFVIFNPMHNIFRTPDIGWFHLGTGTIDSFGKKFTEKGWYFLWVLILIASIGVNHL